MKRIHSTTAGLAAALTACMLCASMASAQEAVPKMSAEEQAMMAAWQKASTPGPQHRQLAEHFAGTWTTKQTMWMDPSAPPMTEAGKATNTAMFGGRQLRMDFSGKFMGQPFQGMGYSGYDNVTGKYQGSWMDNMSTGQFLAQGDYDAASTTYTYRGEMADVMKPGTMIPVREVVRVIDKDHHVMEWYETRDGKEAKSMQIEYARAK